MIKQDDGDKRKKKQILRKKNNSVRRVPEKQNIEHEQMDGSEMIDYTEIWCRSTKKNIYLNFVFKRNYYISSHR